MVDPSPVTPTITFAEVRSPRDAEAAFSHAADAPRSPVDSIYNIRDRSRSWDRNAHGWFHHGPNEDEDPGLRRPSDYKTAQVFRGKTLFWLAYQSVGVIYGDIGTSPLYVYSSTFTSAPGRDDLLGVLSLVLWSLFMMVTVKYVLIILRADNDGEGGTFSTYSLLSRYTNITNRDPREASLIEMKRHKSEDLESAGKHMRKGIESSKIARGLLKVMGVLAVTMVISDGLLTPAQSVLGAVQGIEVVKPDITKSAILGTTNAILVLFFCLQPLGLTKITFLFSPIIIIWLGFNAIFGIYNLVHHDASVFMALNPAYAFSYLARHGEHGWKSLGGVLLAFTGVEALFADLGAFSRRAIQLSWLCFTFPCLILAYVGQAAFISRHPNAYSNPFFNSAPPGMLYPSLIIAILAAIVASQAIVTATFQLLAQVMKLSYFPQIKVIHTSKTFHGQLYVPIANWLLMIGTIAVASIYNNTVSLGNAYGVCVMFVTFFDTCMTSLAAMFVWRINPLFVFAAWLTIASMDGAFLSSALTKVPVGAWLTLTLSALLSILLLLWRFGKEQQWRAEAEDRRPTTHFVVTDKSKASPEVRLTDQYGGTSISKTPGLGIFFDKAGETTPIVFSQFILKLTAMPEVTVFFHLRPIEVPSVAHEDRFAVSRLAIPNCYRLVVRYGFNDQIVSHDLASLIVEQLQQYLVRHDGRAQSPDDAATAAAAARAASSTATSIQTTQDGEGTEPASPDHSHLEVPPTPRTPGFSMTHPEPSSSEKPVINTAMAEQNPELARLQSAFAHSVLYIIGKEQMHVRGSTNFVRAAILHVFLWLRENTRNKMASLKVPTDRLIEVGFLKEIH